MRNKLILFGILFVVASVASVVLVYLSQLRTVSFTLTGSNYEVLVYNDKDDRQIATITDSSSIQVREGNYTYQVAGEDYSDAREAFVVRKDPVDITVEPRYSSEFLREELLEQDPAIRAKITESYQSPAYTIQALQLYEDGRWAAAEMVVETDPRQLPDIYRIVLFNDTALGEWRVVIPPTIAIASSDYPNVPERLIADLYRF